MTIINQDIISDDQEGINVGSPLSYINKLKKIETGELTENTREPQTLTSSRDARPSEWKEETEKDILLYYYRRFGDHTCTDFEKVSKKIAAAVNRSYSKKFEDTEVEKKLVSVIKMEEVVATLSNPVPVKEIKIPQKIKISLLEGNYPYIKGQTELTPAQYDLIPLLDHSNFCFSSSCTSFYLAIKPGCESCFENLFNFSPKEEMVFHMFKEQLGDENKAKKLVLMSRLLNQEVKTPKAKEISVKKIQRKIKTQIVDSVSKDLPPKPTTSTKNKKENENKTLF